MSARINAMLLKTARENYDVHMDAAEEYEDNPELRDTFLKFAIVDDEEINRLTK